MCFNLFPFLRRLCRAVADESEASDAVATFRQNIVPDGEPRVGTVSLIRDPRSLSILGGGGPRCQLLSGGSASATATIPLMCGRFTLRTNSRDLVEVFQLLREPDLTPRYNIAPTQPVAVVRQDGKARELSMVHWGLIPWFSKDPKMGARMINARGDTVATKPSFRTAFKKRRCLVVADGFYEWQKTSGKNKQPHYIRLANDRPFGFAGLWER